MEQKEYWRIKEQVLTLCKDNIVRNFDEAFLKRWNRHKEDNQKEWLLNAFVLPLFLSWFLWYIFNEKTNEDALQLSIIAIMICAAANLFTRIKDHREWVHSEFIFNDVEEIEAKCLSECRVVMDRQVMSTEERKQISEFFAIAETDEGIGSSMYSTWRHNSRKVR
jgi:hypothetical protein